MKNHTIEKLDVSDCPGIAEAINVDLSLMHYMENYEGAPSGTPTKSFDIETAGVLKLTLSNGDILEISISEWGSVNYFAADTTDTSLSTAPK